MASDEGPTGLGQRPRAQLEVARHREAVAQTAAPPFVDALPLPRRILADQHGGELTMPIRTATHRFHRDLPASQVWAHDGRVPGPTIEAERGWPVRVSWRNEIDQPYKVGVSVQRGHRVGNLVVPCMAVRLVSGARG